MNGMTLGQSFDVEVELDKTRTLRIDFNSLCKAERASGLSFLAMTDEINCERLRAMVWASIQYGPEEPRLTLDEVGLLVGEHLIRVYAAFINAWTMAMPDPEDPEMAGDENPLETATAPS